MFCVECGKEIPNGVKFCPDCGASQIVKIEEKPAKAKPKRKTPKKEKPNYSKMSISELKENLNKAKLPTGGNKTQLIKTLKNPDSKETYKRMSTNQLKEVLRKKKLPLSGPKWQLLERLTNKNWKKNERKHHNKRNSAFAHVPSNNDSSVSGLGVLIGLLVIGYGGLLLSAQMEYNDAVDNQNEANEKLGDVGGGEYAVEPGEKKYSACLVLFIGVIILFAYLSKS